MARLVPIMLNLCSICKVLCSTNSTSYYFYSTYLNYKIMSISSLPRSSTLQHTINKLSTYVYKHFEFIFIAFATLVNAYFDKITTIDSPKSHNPVKIMHFIQILSILLAIFNYYADIMLNAFAFLLCSKLCWHNRLKPIYG